MLSLLNELSFVSGKIDFSGSISYSAQQAWLFNDTIRNNILFGMKFESVRYRNVVQMCALNRDIELMPLGDETVVGERGDQLSGGQRARVSLARAIYRDADMYLLDDPLSSLDASVSKHIFNHCILSHLKSKIVILVTHQVQFVHNARKILILNDGNFAIYGTYKQIVTKAIDLPSHLKENIKDYIIETDQTKPVKGAKPKIESMYLSKQMKQIKHVSMQTYWKYFHIGTNSIVLVGFFLLILLSQVLVNTSEIFLSDW